MDSFFKFLKVDPNSKGLFKPNITELDRDMTELNADQIFKTSIDSKYKLRRLERSI